MSNNRESTVTYRIRVGDAEANLGAVTVHPDRFVWINNYLRLCPDKLKRVIRTVVQDQNYTRLDGFIWNLDDFPRTRYSDLVH